VLLVEKQLIFKSYKQLFPKTLSDKSQTFPKFAFFIEIKPKSYKIQAMLQIAFIRENQEKVILWQREEYGVLWKMSKLDEQRRATQVELTVF
jgi:hypothetical protein